MAICATTGSKRPFLLRPLMIMWITLVPIRAEAAESPYKNHSIASLCSAVDAQILTIEPQHSLSLYAYQDILGAWAGVDASDTPEVANQKIGRYLNTNLPHMTCSTPNFVPAGGSLLKLAVARQSSDFIGYVLSDWKVNLNYIDKIDGRTVLDYIRDRRRANGPAGFGRTLDNYYRRFRAAGAKHASEMTQGIQQ